MKLFHYLHINDYGHEWYLNVLCTKCFNLLQFNVDWSYYPSRPIIMISLLGESLFGFSISLYQFSCSFDFLSYRPRNLNAMDYQ